MSVGPGGCSGGCSKWRLAGGHQGGLLPLTLEHHVADVWRANIPSHHGSTPVNYHHHHRHYNPHTKPHTFADTDSVIVIVIAQNYLVQ